MASVGKYVEVGGRRLYQLRTGGIAKGRVDSYRVVGCRGSGGFGAIYTVRRRSDNLLAVLKMSTDEGKNMSGGERIRREAWVMRKCGMHFEGILRDGQRNRDGSYSNLLLYGKLDSDPAELS